MGDRAHIIINEASGKPIYLYTHWSGWNLHNIVANALDRGRSRWGDDSYLNRVIASELFKDAGIDDVTGAGLATDWMEGESKADIYVDTIHNTVKRKDKTRTFDEFIAWQKTHTGEYGESSG